MKVIKAPNNRVCDDEPTIFLAGSIEMGKAENWQDKVSSAFSKSDVVIFNPRRDDWDSSWTQELKNDQFRDQVIWELDAMEQARLIMMYFDPNTKSPITLLELGLWTGMNRNKLIVCCPNGFWRKGNVDVVCKRYGVMQVETLEDLIATAKIRLGL